VVPREATDESVDNGDADARSGSGTGTASASPGTAVEPAVSQPPRAVSVRQLPTLRYRRTPIWRRLAALGGLGAIGVVLGVLLAIAVAAAVIALLFLVNSAAR